MRIRTTANIIHVRWLVKPVSMDDYKYKKIRVQLTPGSPRNEFEKSPPRLIDAGYEENAAWTNCDLH